MSVTRSLTNSVSNAPYILNLSSFEGVRIKSLRVIQWRLSCVPVTTRRTHATATATTTRDEAAPSRRQRDSPDVLC
ncbi:hypothetical protein GUJ93_ZPchr0007g3922 [Zizania palustris]|uniref:Uncharacterized protein n=1 Tax=Zizania palustris TaxID=103762 RepID=A0A8J5TDR6_ZIZPA|nr:hypothetical protein GUJ93_ZPchr0007g3922 [Zizania palustris]